MDGIIIILFIVIISIISYYIIYLNLENDDTFQLDHYLLPNYESGANMIRGDVPIIPTQQSWFNTRYGPNSFVYGFIPMEYN